MKTVQELLLRKEAQLQQIQKELEALRIVARMMEDEAPEPMPSIRPAQQVRPIGVVEQSAKPQFP